MPLVSCYNTNIVEEPVQYHTLQHLSTLQRREDELWISDASNIVSIYIQYSIIHLSHKWMH